MKHTVTAVLLGILLYAAWLPAAMGATVPDNSTLGLEVLSVDRDGRVVLACAYPNTAVPEAQLSVTVNGSDWRYTEAGSGSGDGKRYRTLELIPGSPGAKEIVVTATAGSSVWRGKTSIIYAPAPLMAPAWVDGELFTDTPELTVRMRFISGFTATVDGRPVGISWLKAIFAEGMEQVAWLEATLDAGLNTFALQGRDYNHIARNALPNLYFAPGGIITSADNFSIVYGESGSRSGPFYQYRLEGDALTLVGDGETPDGRLFVMLRGERPGTATLHISRQEHFRGEYVPLRSLTLTVR